MKTNRSPAIRALWLSLLFAGAPGLAFSQEEFSLDDVAAAPAPAPKVREPAATPATGGTTVNLYADLDFVARFPLGTGTPAADPTAGFQQNHAAVLLKALYNGDQASMLVDALHPDAYFELKLNGSFFGPAFTRIPIAGTSSWRFGRILVPFGDFEFHHLYGGYVDESGLLFNKLWSDLGVAWKFTVTEGLESETMVGNGFGSAGNDPSFQSANLDNNLGKALVERVRWAPSPSSYVLVSGYWGQWGANDDTQAWLGMAGLDAGGKFGPWGLKAGGFVNPVFGSLPKAFVRYAWYGEAKWTLASDWAVRARAGAMNPDTRARDAADQWNLNAAVLWNSGPLALEAMYSINQEVYSPWNAAEPNNYHQVLVKGLLNL